VRVVSTVQDLVEKEAEMCQGECRWTFDSKFGGLLANGSLLKEEWRMLEHLTQLSDQIGRTGMEGASNGYKQKPVYQVVQRYVYIRRKMVEGEAPKANGRMPEKRRAT